MKTVIAAIILLIAPLAHAIDGTTGQRGVELMVNVPGWTAEPAAANIMHTPFGPIWIVTRQYREGKKRIDVTGVFGPRPTDNRTFDQLAGETREGITTVAVMQGLPVVMTDMKERKDGIIAVMLGDYAPNAEIPGVLNFSWHGTSLPGALTFASKFDWAAFSRLANEKPILPEY